MKIVLAMIFGAIFGALLVGHAQTPAKESHVIYDALLKLDNYTATNLMELFDKGQMVVTMGTNGSVTYGPGFKADEAAKIFWGVLARQYPVFCQERTVRK